MYLYISLDNLSALVFQMRCKSTKLFRILVSCKALIFPFFSFGGSC